MQTTLQARWRQLLKKYEHYNAIVSLNPHLSQQQESDETKPNIMIKDCFETADWPSFVGLRNFHHTTSAPLICKLQQRATIIAKTNVPALCNDIQTFNTQFGTTCNPYNAQLTPGGSSGGSAVVVALNIVPLAIGTDMAGSLRIPAAFCGVWAIRPSCMRIDSSGMIPPHKAVDAMVKHHYFPIAVPGALAKNVSMLEWFMQTTMDSYKGMIKISKPIRIAITTHLDGVPTDYRIVQQMNLLKNKLNDTNLCTTAMTMPNLNWNGVRTAYMEYTKPIVAGTEELVIDKVKSFKVNAKEHEQAYQNIVQSWQVLDEFFEHYDAWIMPVSPCLPYKHNPKRDNLQVPVSEEGQVASLSYWKQISYCSPISVLTLPVACMPCGMIQTENGALPFAVQGTQLVDFV